MYTTKKSQRKPSQKKKTSVKKTSVKKTSKSGKPFGYIDMTTDTDKCFRKVNCQTGGPHGKIIVLKPPNYVDPPSPKSYRPPDNFYVPSASLADFVQQRPRSKSTVPTSSPALPEQSSLKRQHSPSKKDKDHHTPLSPDGKKNKKTADGEPAVGDLWQEMFASEGAESIRAPSAPTFPSQTLFVPQGNKIHGKSKSFSSLGSRRGGKKRKTRKKGKRKRRKKRKTRRRVKRKRTKKRRKR
jgi:hypothetical protein